MTLDLNRIATINNLFAQLEGQKLPPAGKERDHYIANLEALRQSIAENGAAPSHYEDVQKYAHLIAADLKTLFAECNQLWPQASRLVKQDILNEEDIERLTEQHNQLSQRLSEVLCLSPEEELSERYQQSYTQQSSIRKRIDRARVILRIDQEAQSIWADKTLERNNPDVFLRIQQELLARIRTLIRDKDDWSVGESNQLYALEGRATTEYNIARERHNIPTTKQEGEVAQVVVEFDRLAEKLPGSIVTYFTTAEDIKVDPDDPMQKEFFRSVTSPMPVEEALRIARDKLRLFWIKKIGEYLSNAENILNTNQPREALTALKEWQKLQGLHDPRVGISLPEDSQRRIDAVSVKIDQELQKLQAAEALAKQAENKVESNPVAADQLWKQANEVYSHAPLLLDLHRTIVKRAKDEMAGLTSRLENDIKKENWVAVKSNLDRGQQLLEIGPQIGEVHGSTFNQLKTIFEDVQAALGQQSLEQQQAKLEDLKGKYVDRWSDWKGLRSRLAEVQTRNSVQGIIATIDKACRADAALLDLLQIQQDGHQKERELPSEWSPTEKTALVNALKKLDAWIGLAAARDESHKNATTGEETDLVLVDVPDLGVWQAGLEKAKQDKGAKQEATKLKLDKSLEQLKTADKQIAPEVEKFTTQLPEADQNTLRQYLKTIVYYLKTPNSYRAELIQLKWEIENRLVTSINEEIKRILQQTGPLYQKLEIGKTEGLLKELREISQSIRARQPAWQPVFDPEQASGPIAAARAYEKVVLAQNKQGDWQTAQAAWREAVVAIKEHDSALKSYARRQERMAHKEVIFQQVDKERFDNPISSERLLYGLCEDPLLSLDWQVWRKHGQFCLEWITSTVIADSSHLNVAELRPRLQKARVSLNRAIECLKNDFEASIIADKVKQIEEKLLAVSEWELIVDLRVEVQKLLEPDVNHRLTSRNCQTATENLKENYASLKLDETKQYVRDFWRQQQRIAKRLLESQLKSEEEKKDIFNQIDTLLAMIAIEIQIDQSLSTPASSTNDGSARIRLQEVIFQAVREIRDVIKRLYGDYAATNFKTDYDNNNSGQELPDQDVARQQRERVKAVQTTQLQPLQAAIRLNKLTDVIDLVDEDTKLAEWLESLRQLEFSLGQALNLAQDGLQDPDQFEKARYILRKGGSNTDDVPQVPLNFRDRSHPTYRWYEEQVTSLQQQRERQEGFKQRIETILRQEREFARQILAFRNGSEKNEEAIQGLPGIVEQALLTIQEMQKDNPQDTTGLQETITYQMIEAEGRLYRSPGAISSILQAKRDQLAKAQEWFDQFQLTSVSDARGIPIVNWISEKPKLVHLRNSGPKGLLEARQKCRQMLEGNEENLYEGQYPLQPALTLISWEAMVAYLKQFSNAPEQTVIVYAITEEVNQQRLALQQSLQLDLKNCMAFEADLTRRINDYNSVFDVLTDAYNRIMVTRKWPWQQWQNLPAWDSFSHAVAQFCQICPEYAEFKEIVQDVRRRTGLLAACLEKEIKS